MTEWTSKRIATVVVIVVVVVVGGSLGTFLYIEATKLPDIFVREASSSLSGCGFFAPPGQDLTVQFDLVNLGNIPGFITIHVFVDGVRARDFKYLLISGETTVKDETFRIGGCGDPLITYDSSVERL